MKAHWDGNANDHLGDEDLLDREVSERREFMRLEKREPHLHDTNYLELKGSRALMHAWERWSKTNIAIRIRGLFPRQT